VWQGGDGEKELWSVLVENGFAGREFDLCLNELSAYTIPVLEHWLRNGVIFRRAHWRGPRGSFGGHRPGPDDVDELVQQTLDLALRLFFRHVREGRGWAPEGGASLRTYFVGTCLLVFPDAFKEWWKQQHPGTVPLDPEMHPPFVDQGFDDIETRDAVLRLLEEVGEDDRDWLGYRLDGESDQEIADRLTISRKAVESKFARIIKRLRRTNYRSTRTT
jgi:DNA-directed RNA polymerase specialized sigma24 family protein